MTVLRLSELCRGNADILTWITEHGLDPIQVACGDTEGPFIDGDQMTVHLYLTDLSGGNRYLAPGETLSVATEVHTVKLLRPPPDLLATDGQPFPATVPA